jgi:hypothetical protein
MAVWVAILSMKGGRTMVERREGEYIPFETRAEAHDLVDKNKRYKQILECLQNKPQTAKEVACSMLARGYIPYCDRNFTAPRLTELSQMGKVDVIGRKECKWTHRQVSVYAIREVNHGT